MNTRMFTPVKLYWFLCSKQGKRRDALQHLSHHALPPEQGGGGEHRDQSELHQGREREAPYVKDGSMEDGFSEPITEQITAVLKGTYYENTFPGIWGVVLGLW